jgi:ubiquinol-cytochrome c reductase cytochrome b subunit
VLSFYVVLLVAGGQDIIAQKLNVSIEPVTNWLRALVFLVPLAAALFTWRFCHDLALEVPRPPRRVRRAQARVENGAMPPPEGLGGPSPADGTGA